MIPLLIHQTAKTSEVSPRWAPLQKKLWDLHPGWTYRLWTDTDNLALIRERRPDLEGVYHRLPRPIMRADLIRYVFMEQFGGLYLDTDYQMLKPFDLGDRPLVLPRESNDDQPVFLGNCLFSSVPGHPFWSALLHEIETSFSEKALVEDDVIQSTGPGMVTQVWKAAFQDDATIFVPPRLWFHPPVPQGDGELAPLLADSSVYGIHWCFGSWRALSPWARLKNRLKRVFGQ